MRQYGNYSLACFTAVSMMMSACSAMGDEPIVAVEVVGRVPAENVLRVVDSAQEAVEANRLALQTWSGSGEFVVSQRMSADGAAPSDLPTPEHRNSVVLKHEGSFRFLADMRQSRYRSEFVPKDSEISELLDSSRRRLESGDYERRSIILPEKAFTLKVLQHYGRLKEDPRAIGWASSTSKVVDAESSIAVQRLAKFSDVVMPTTWANADQPFDELLRLSSLKYKADPSMVLVEYVRRMHRARECVRITEVSNDKQFCFEYTMDPECGMNLVEACVYMVQEARRVIDRSSIAYDFRSGVWVPVQYLRAAGFDATGEPTVQRKFDISEMEINVPLEDDQFTVGSLGLVEGDRVRELPSNELFIYGRDGSLMTTEEFERVRGRREERRSDSNPDVIKNARPGWVVFAFWVNLSAFGAMCIYLVTRKRLVE